MTLFDIGHADAFDLITVDEDRQFLLGQRCPDGPRGIVQGVDQSWADRERRRLERGVLKRSSSPEPRLPRAAHRAWVQATKKRTVVTTEGTRTSFEAGISAQSAFFPQASPHAEHDAGCRRCVGPHKDLGPHRSHLFTAVRRRRHSPSQHRAAPPEERAGEDG
ncbi:hypothetical protein GWK47_050767 [Chionoecetes opilio]|uniref:Uncharacterized protein n=1 Tax=Chionoecetes opilio TaxID=41210 RepID=A0A8J5CSQ7_CHIOP|nr:hypothetical protein GWK47_050767 [Chionoecetes opilio]